MKWLNLKTARGIKIWFIGFIELIGGIGTRLTVHGARGKSPSGLLGLLSTLG
jgi:hypothetical protein